MTDSPVNIAAPHNEITFPKLTGDVDGDVLLLNYDDFRGHMSVGNGAVWGSLAEKAERVRERKAKEPRGSKGPKARKAKEPKGRKPKRSLTVVRGGAPKEPPPSAPAST